MRMRAATLAILAAAACAAAQEPSAPPAPGETPAPPASGSGDPAAPAPAEPPPAATALEVAIEPAAPTAPATALGVEVRSSLPEGAVLSASILRLMRSTDGAPMERWVNSRRARVAADGACRIDFAFEEPLAAGRYRMTVAFDAARQTPTVREACTENLAGEGAVQVGTDEEVALELEWGETKIWAAWGRLDAARDRLRTGTGAAGAGTDEVRAAIAATVNRLGLVLSGSPVAQVVFPRSEEALATYGRTLAEAADGLSAGTLPASVEIARGQIPAVVAREFAETTLVDQSGWMAFVHQEFWLNRTYGRLGEERWAEFLAHQRQRLETIAATYRSYREPGAGPHAEVAPLMPDAPLQNDEMLRALIETFEMDRRNGHQEMGPESRSLFQRIPLHRRR